MDKRADVKITFRKEWGQLVPYSEADKKAIDKLSDRAAYEVDIKNLDMRTVQQNAAMWKWAEMIAESLNNQGLYIQSILKADAQWNKDRVKANVFNAVIESFGKKSSTKLDKKEIDELIDVVTKAFGMKGISIPEFPSKKGEY